MSEKLDEIIANVLGKSNTMVDIDARSMAAPPKSWDERQCPCCGKWIVRFQDFFSNYCKAKHISFPGGPLPEKGDPVYNDVMKLWENPMVAILCCKCEKKAAGEYHDVLDFVGAPAENMFLNEYYMRETPRGDLVDAAVHALGSDARLNRISQMAIAAVQRRVELEGLAHVEQCGDVHFGQPLAAAPDGVRRGMRADTIVFDEEREVSVAAHIRTRILDLLRTCTVRNDQEGMIQVESAIKHGLVDAGITMPNDFVPHSNAVRYWMNVMRSMAERYWAPFNMEGNGHQWHPHGYRWPVVVAVNRILDRNEGIMDFHEETFEPGCRVMITQERMPEFPDVHAEQHGTMVQIEWNGRMPRSVLVNCDDGANIWVHPEHLRREPEPFQVGDRIVANCTCTQPDPPVCNPPMAGTVREIIDANYISVDFDDTSVCTHVLKREVGKLENEQ